MSEIAKGRALPKRLVDCVVRTRTDDAVALGSLLQPKPTAIVFIRHFGCLGCSVQMADLAPRLEEMHKLGLDVLIVGNGAPHFIDGFIERFGLDENLVTVVTDPTLQTHRAAQLRRSFWSTLGPRGLLDQIRALIGGHSQHHVQGDNWQQGGAMLIDGDGSLVYYHVNESVTDHARSNELVDNIYGLLMQKDPLYS